MTTPQTTVEQMTPSRAESLDVDLTRFTSTLRSAWRTIALAGVLGGAVAAGISLQMRNVYRAQVLLAPVTSGQAGMEALRGALGGLGSLAAVAGIDIEPGGGKREEFVAVLRSAGFARRFIESEQLMPVLFEKRWNPTSKSWKADAEPPTVQDGVRYFHSKVMSVIEDSKTGLITISVDWYSPELASQWANRLVEIANERARGDAIRNAERSIEYLNQELSKAGVLEVQQAIYRLIEAQVQTAMLANVQREYAFRVLDPAVPSDLKHKVAPSRALISISGAFGSALVCAFAVLWSRRREWNV